MSAKCQMCRKKIKEQDYISELKEKKPEIYENLWKELGPILAEIKKDKGEDVLFCSRGCFKTFASMAEDPESLKDEGWGDIFKYFKKGLKAVKAAIAAWNED